ncbi:MAG: indolepyruvate ferredoxin oxidoreductase subunit alpha [Treponema sp.]|jgi:indolepyruvate ferredoxin oxidoreductase alpha subunit|nr:indolepyruvate ferredoxin oxidoreductase subunit alpha [Treponema sp.]
MSDSNSTGQTEAYLGDEAVAAGALHAGLSAAYGYPGTPSTEIMEYLIAQCGQYGEVCARWCANEKTAAEAALGTSFAGHRALVTMKHVGLNVAADPFINGSLLGIHGGLVIAAADDPGMHSSQNEQDSRFYASFAMIPCLEPRNQQEAYDMTRDAFDISERFHVPVMIRLTTRLAHARAAVVLKPVREQNPCIKIKDKTEWMLLPVFARRNYARLIEKQESLSAWSDAHPVNRLEMEGRDTSFAVITSGLGGNYYEENLEDLTALHGKAPARLHIGAYPLPLNAVRNLCEKAEKVLLLEEGQPFIEEKLRGILPLTVKIAGKLKDFDGKSPGPVVRTGELDPDNVRAALGLPPLPTVLSSLSIPPRLPNRPPQLCAGCPHGDSYTVIKKVTEELDPAPNHPSVALTSDIGCYSLGASPPWQIIESIVCMGASIGMARGAAEAGIPYAAAVIGDSTFLHSGMTGLLDAVSANTPMTLIILDNSIVAMTGCQETIIPSAKLRSLILGLGVAPEHLVELEAKKQFVEENAALLKKEMEYRGVSVVIFKRECLEAARKRLKRG